MLCSVSLKCIKAFNVAHSSLIVHNDLSSSYLQCIDEEGFRLFLKTYLEVEDFPTNLCQRLFKSFQNSESAKSDENSGSCIGLNIVHVHTDIHYRSKHLGVSSFL